jgi:hypothetical protein
VPQRPDIDTIVGDAWRWFCTLRSIAPAEAC